MILKFNNLFTIGKSKIVNGGQPYIIAEMACAHDGFFEKAVKIIDAAANAGADAIQLQFFIPDETVTPQHSVYDTLKKIAFSSNQWSDLVKYARSKKLDVFTCTFDLPSVQLAISLEVDCIKLNSSDLSNPEVVIAVSKSGIPFTLGTGASTLNEIRSGLKVAHENGARNIILMHGVQNFPTQIQDLNISRIALLKEQFGMPIGYHDHTDAELPFSKIVDLLAIGLGVCVIEKHITLDRFEKGIDHQAALEPIEFKEFVQNLRLAFVAMGQMEEIEFSESSLRYRKFQKKSVVAGVDIQLGQIITRSDVKFIRNVEPGIAPSEFSLIEGKKANKVIKKFNNILPSDIH